MPATGPYRYFPQGRLGAGLDWTHLFEDASGNSVSRATDVFKVYIYENAAAQALNEVLLTLTEGAGLANGGTSLAIALTVANTATIGAGDRILVIESTPSGGKADAFLVGVLKICGPSELPKVLSSGAQVVTIGAETFTVQVQFSALSAIAANSVFANATTGAAVPTALAMAASTIVARLASGNIIAATIAQLLTLLGLSSPVAISDGGTGQTAQTAAFDALAPTTSKGDVIVHDGSDNLRLAAGANDQVLTADSAEALGVKWAPAPGAGGGEANTASNLGAGVGVFEGKSGVELQFRSLVSQNNILTVAEDVPNDEIDLTINEANLALNAVRKVVAGSGNSSGSGLYRITGASVTLTFTSADIADVTFTCYVKNESATTATLATQGSETIEGLASWPFLDPNASMMLYSDGTNLRTL